MTKKKTGKPTAEDVARYEKHQRMLRERLAYREAKEREQDEQARRER